MREASSQRGIERRPAGRPWQWPFAKAPGSLALPTAPVLPRTPARRWLAVALQLLLLLVLLWPPALFAAVPSPETHEAHETSVLRLEGGVDRFDGWPAVRVLFDPSHDLSLDEVMARRDDFRIPDVPKANFGPRPETLWLRLPVQAEASDRWIAEIDYPPLNRIEAWVVLDGRIVGHALMGSDIPSGQRPSRSRAHVFGVDFQPGPVHEIYLRIDSATTVVTPIRIHREAGFIAYESLRMLLLGLVFGATILLIATTLIDGISLRDPAFFFYALMLSGIMMFFTSFSGLGHQLLWPTQEGLLVMVSPIGALIAVTAASFFVILALNMHERSPRLARCLQVTACCALLSVLAVIFGLLNYRQASLAATMLGPIQVVLALTESIRQARAGSRIAVYMVIGWGAYAIGSSSLALLLRGRIPADFLTQNLFQFSTLIEMLAWMQVLAIRIEQIRKHADRVGAEKQVLHALAHTDPLTGLLNRRGLVQAIDSLLAQPQPVFAVYLIDLDGFKAINDQLGHEAGDETLVRVGRRLRQVLRDDDVLARLGGDEFVVLTAGLPDRPTALAIGQKMLDAIVEPANLADGRPANIGATIGLALAPDDGDRADLLLRAADAAMYAGKSSGRHCVRQFEAA